MPFLTPPTHWRTFIIVWSGQMVSTIGSYMTRFALTIWLWNLTAQATPIALLAFFTEVPALLISPLAGAIADQFSRKKLMILGDTVVGCSTMIILLLYLTDNLELWHLYLTGAFNGAFARFQKLAYTASITMLVPQEGYTRASGMGSVLHYGSVIIAPAVAGALYPVVDLLGILFVDLITFIVAVTTVLFVNIPHPVSASPSPTQIKPRSSIWQQIKFGFEYIFTRPSLFSLIIIAAIFQFSHDIGKALYSPMILARSGNDTQVLGIVSAAAGIGGIFGTIVITGWRIKGKKIDWFLLSIMGAGLSKTVFGMGQNLLIWFPTQFLSSISFPIMGSAKQAIILTKIEANIQGRIIATSSALIGVASPLAKLIAGFLTDQVFTPAMEPGGILTRVFGGIFGVGNGSGIALLYTLSSVGLIIVGISAYSLPNLREIETLLPDAKRIF
ncbi:MFS transporter [Nodularia sp. UHCC 0506]|uniref:MFS transporter n=1 Tax=Nodularia sp. UHCC 0506 TaxID=3110243 RepID=UPI002B1F4B1E|nr:MFS transporter [Nodularia sp. UHCC 0506]MEA5516461.1 MFS transporter [Nodularia sp. UHCC 0506]